MYNSLSAIVAMRNETEILNIRKKMLKGPEIERQMVDQSADAESIK